ncbi:uncharacterized mitochondrial protein AtMg00240-like [Solanum stenotomum]|uniref:uncharacterized mitochondrial protein AtMg00240-like n=1 Tax=Solanum stenotomum TaxID=172797 RepID=UPI0020D10A4C|nr:uncharacterized mitochondrial protein AtMg00240-like [Solanum stenotomum]
MLSAKVLDTLMSTSIKLDMDEEGIDVNQTMYRGIIGSLLYLTVSRQDIVFSVGMCARFQTAPRESHLKAAKRILRYLKGTQDLVLFYPSGDSFDLIGYVDADYADCLVDRKSTFGMVPFLSTSAMNMAKNPVQHKRTKHIDARHHFLMDSVEKSNVVMRYCKIEDQVADISTKALSKEKIIKNRLKLGLHKIT